MVYWFDQDFLWVLFRSETFFEILLTWGTPLVALATLGIWAVFRLSRRISVRKLHADVQGSATAVDFTLTFPIFLMILLLIIQLMIMLNGALIVHYAAYAAARSARVWMWDSDPWRPGALVGTSADRLLENPLVQANRSDDVRRRVEQAARFALVAASPADDRIPSSPVDVPERIIQSMAKTVGHNERAAVLLLKARYAFDPQNAHTEFDVASGSKRAELYPDLLKAGDAWAVTATVSFRLHLGIPVARFLGSDRGDGNYYRSVTAEVTLL